jgi:hypothetical protein
MIRDNDAIQRVDLMAVLEALPPEGWSHAATVTTGAGKVIERTVLAYAQSLAEDEGQHVEQIAAIVKI